MTEDPIDKLTNLPPEYVERIKARSAARKAQMDQSIETEARRFKFRDSVHGSHRTPDG